jgi:hypothetical protein
MYHNNIYTTKIRLSNCELVHNARDTILQVRPPAAYAQIKQRKKLSLSPPLTNITFRISMSPSKYVLRQKHAPSVPGLSSLLQAYVPHNLQDKLSACIL